jgi:hypothetical protein
MKKLIIVIALLVPTLFSCKKVLDTQSELYIDQTESIVDKRSAQAALIGAYNALSQNSYQGNTFRYITNLLSDNLKWVGNSPTNREFDVYGVFTTNSRVQELWSAIYRTVNIANNVLEKVPTVNDVTLDQADRNKARGEAYFLRALSYFDLVRLWAMCRLFQEPHKHLLMQRIYEAVRRQPCTSLLSKTLTVPKPCCRLPSTATGPIKLPPKR